MQKNVETPVHLKVLVIPILVLKKHGNNAKCYCLFKQPVVLTRPN